MTDLPERVFRDFMQLEKDDRRWVLEQTATREEADPTDMFVSAAAVLSADQFEEAQRELRARGYAPLACAPECITTQEEQSD